MPRAGFPSEDLYPDEDLYPGDLEYRAEFQTPTESHRYRIEGRALIGEVARGLTLWRTAGLWHSSWTPSADDVAGADLVYEGGRVHELDTDAVELLSAAGYGDFITILEVL